MHIAARTCDVIARAIRWEDAPTGKATKSTNVRVDAAGARRACASRVAFERAASNLVAGDTHGLTDVFPYALASDSTARLSVSTFARTRTSGYREPLDPFESAWTEASSFHPAP